ncbi:MAG: hypothetical protein QM673_00480 [Gordonia sp. (in: high G+C Gram-positive bacteria)]
MSHSSAAALHRLPLLKPDVGRVHVVTGLPSGGSIGSYRHVHAAPVRPAELMSIDGVVVTTLERTAVDVATTSDFAQALTAFDQALRLGADRAHMREILAQRRQQRIGFSSGRTYVTDFDWDWLVVGYRCVLRLGWLFPHNGVVPAGRTRCAGTTPLRRRAASMMLREC